MEITTANSDPGSDQLTSGVEGDIVQTSELDRLQQLAGRFVDDEYSQFLRGAYEDVVGPFQALFRQLARDHQLLYEELEGKSVRPDWQVQRNYRESVERDVIEKIQDYLEKRSPADQLARRYFEFVSRLESHARTYREEITIPEPDDYFQVNDHDSFSLSTRKTGMRTARSLTRVWDRIKSIFGKPDTRRVVNVPVGDLVTYHLKRRVPAVTVNVYKRLNEDISRCIAGLEEGVSSWFSGVLKADRELDRVAATGARSKDDDASTPDAEHISLFAEILESAQYLQDVLEKECQFQSLDKLAPENVFSFSRQIFERTFEGHGKFLLPLPVSQLGDPAVIGGARDYAAEWKQWHAQVVDRMIMINRLIDLRDEMLSIESEVIQDIRSKSIQPFKEAFSRLSNNLKAAHEVAVETGSTVAADADLLRFADVIAELREELIETTDWLSSMPGFIASDVVLDHLGEGAWQKLHSFVDELPESVTIHPVQQPGSVDARAGVRTIRMRETVRQTLHTDLSGRLSTVALPVKRELVKSWASAEHIAGIIRFNIDAALDEIDAYLNPEENALSESSETDEESEIRTANEVRDTALELAGDGIKRASDSISDIIGNVERQLESLIARVGEELLDDWTVIHKTVRTADDAAEQWAAAFSLAGQRWDKLRFDLRTHLTSARSSVRQWIRMGEREARGLIRKGQTAVGVLDQSETQRSETIKVISEVSQFKSTLPVVYRRLFTFEELTTPNLLEARSRDLVWLRSFVSGWEAGRNGGVAVIIGEPGAGKSSYLNVLGETALKAFPTTSIKLTERPESEPELVDQLSSSLHISGSCKTFDDLAEEINRDETHRCVLIDDIEHLFLQTANGRDLLERFMLFLSRSDQEVCWIMTIGKSAWKYLARTAGSIVGFVSTYELSSIDKSGFDAIIESRHRRSGMPLVFKQASHGTATLKDKLTGSKTADETQTSLRGSYFETLHKVSGQNIMLALLYWIHSVEFSDEGELIVNPVKPLSFEFLNHSDRGLAFSLRSTLIHRTLNVSEHNRILNCSDDESSFLLERLFNDRLICPAGKSPDAGVIHPERFGKNLRFRIHPLVLHPVMQMLSRNNLLH